MVFERQEPGQWKAGALALLVHALFLGLMVFGVSWQNREPAAVEAELWSSLPNAATKPLPPPPPPEPEPRPEPKPKVVKPEPPPEVKPDKAEIELEAKEAKRKEEEKKRKEEELKQEKEKQKLEREKKEELEKKKKADQEKADRLREQQAQADARKAQADAVAAQQAARARAVEGYVGKIIAKIRPRIVDQPCLPLGDPEVRFAITLMPTGELLFDPKLVKSSGASACDQAIERAIMLAQPFPKPDPGIRDLNLIFWPNRKE